MFSKCLSLIHHNDSYAFETGTRFYTPNVKGVNYKFKTESQYCALTAARYISDFIRGTIFVLLLARYEYLFLLGGASAPLVLLVFLLLCNCYIISSVRINVIF